MISFKDYIENFIGSLFPTADFEDGESDYGQAYRYFESLKGSFNWEPQYHQEVVSVIYNGITRIKETIKQKGGRLKTSPFFGYISIARIPTNKIVDRGDMRYGSEELASKIQQHFDLVPVLIAEAGGVFHLQDGHHRLRAYQMMQQPVLSFVIGVTPTNDPSMFGKLVFK